MICPKCNLEIDTHEDTHDIGELTYHAGCCPVCNLTPTDVIHMDADKLDDTIWKLVGVRGVAISPTDALDFLAENSGIVTATIRVVKDIKTRFQVTLTNRDNKVSSATENRLEVAIARAFVDLKIRFRQEVSDV